MENKRERYVELARLYLDFAELSKPDKCVFDRHYAKLWKAVPSQLLETDEKFKAADDRGKLDIILNWTYARQRAQKQFPELGSLEEDANTWYQNPRLHALSLSQDVCLTDVSK